MAMKIEQSATLVHVFLTHTTNMLAQGTACNHVPGLEGPHEYKTTVLHFATSILNFQTEDTLPHNLKRFPRDGWTTRMLFKNFFSLT